MDTASNPRGRSWTPIGETSHQLIVYHPPSHAIQVVPRPRSSSNRTPPSAHPRLRLLPHDSSPALIQEGDDTGDEQERPNCPLCGHSWAFSPTEVPQLSDDRHSDEAGYFRVLGRAHELSRPGTPVANDRQRSPVSEPFPWNDDSIDEADMPAMGYYQRFFKEEGRIGIGAAGSVYLATHVISGNVLGTYAVKKIAVGTSKSYLVSMLREVRLLETLRHPNIIPYYHSWVDETRFSSFGPPIVALHVLMMYASGGNLDAFLLSRSHGTEPPQKAGDAGDADDIDLLPKEERIKAFKRRRQSGTNHRLKESRGVLLLGIDEILSLFGDVTEGLTFLHANSVLHLDLKCSNVLLHWEEGNVVPKALLSDFGTSEEMLRGGRERTGHTGTMEYMAPETIVVDANGNWRPSDSHADMWSLGMILHKMIFLRLPYFATDDLSALHCEIVRYAGFQASPEIASICQRRHIPHELLDLLEKLLSLTAERRPTADKVKATLKRLKSPAYGFEWKRWWGVPRGQRNYRGSSATRPSKVDPQEGGDCGNTQASTIPAIMGPPVPAEEQAINGVRAPTPQTVGRLIFVAKVMTQHPALLGTSLPTSLMTVLTVLALYESAHDTLSAATTISLGAVHAAALLYFLVRPAN